MALEPARRICARATASRRPRTATLVSGAATVVVVVALVLAATGAVSTAAHRTTTTGAKTSTAGALASVSASPTSSPTAMTSRGGAPSHANAANAANAAAGTTAATSTAAAGVPGPSGSGVLAGTTTTTPDPASLPCQGTTPLGLSGNWSCTFDDEFDGTTLNTSKWVAQVTSNSGYLNGETACYENNPDTVLVAGGTLNLSVRRVAPFTCSYPGGSFETSYEAGMVSTYGLFDQTYGAYEVNAKLPAATISGLQETMWLYPQNLTYGPWPGSGEIDFAEFFSQYPNLDVPYVHYANSSSDPTVTAYDCTLDQNAFNTYEIDWQPGTITVLYNGKTCLVDHPMSGSAPFDQPFFIALTQALGVGTNAFSASLTPLPATTQIDWVRAWSPSS